MNVSCSKFGKNLDSTSLSRELPLSSKAFIDLSTQSAGATKSPYRSQAQVELLC